ncbi:MAG: FtsX-like permease family protein [Planctomycetota bacterium]
MKLGDLFSFAFAGFSRRKGRTALTILGVTVGTLALMLIVSLGQGLRGQVTAVFSTGESLRQILVRPGNSRPDKSRREEEIEDIEKNVAGELQERLIRAVQRRRGGPRAYGMVRLQPERLEELSAIEHVERVDPIIIDQFEMSVEGFEPSLGTLMALGDAEARLAKRLVAGRAPDEDAQDEVVVHELWLYRLGLTDQDEQKSLVGSTLTLSSVREGGGGLASLIGLPDLSQLAEVSEEEREVVQRVIDRFRAQSDREEGDAVVSTESFRIVGIVGEPEEEDLAVFERSALAQADLFALPFVASKLYFRAELNRAVGFPGVLVVVDDPENAEAVVDAVEELGLQANYAGEILEEIQSFLTIVTLLVALFSLTALLVAALGIVNTLAMSVLERTKEIGILKALGARDKDLRRLFLLEGSMIGFGGFFVGWILAFLISLPIEAIGRSIFEQETGRELLSELFPFPWWLPASALLVAMLLGTLAAVWPARRAVRVDPVRALRYE